MNPKSPRSERSPPLDDPLISILAKSIRYAVRILAVLIAIEIFINITSYLRENVIHIKIVLAMAFMAVARKVIVLDYNEVSADYTSSPPLP